MDTLEQVVAEYKALGAKIEALQSAAASPIAPAAVDVPAVHIELQPGERYAGLVLDKHGKPLHHLVLLAGQAHKVSWSAAQTWAARAGGSLPTRSEQALLYANVKDAFAAAWYWSSEPHEEDGSCAWNQYFSYGGQGSLHKSYEGRARAVRLIPVEP